MDRSGCGENLVNHPVCPKPSCLSSTGGSICVIHVESRLSSAHATQLHSGFSDGSFLETNGLARSLYGVIVGEHIVGGDCGHGEDTRSARLRTYAATEFPLCLTDFNSAIHAVHPLCSPYRHHYITSKHEGRGRNHPPKN